MFAQALFQPSYHPQIYVEGERIGGVDIAEEIYRSGELQQLLRTISPAA